MSRPLRLNCVSQGSATGRRVTAGMDLALALVEDDLGRSAALTIARWLVMFLHRPGKQAQFSTHLATQYADHPPIRELHNGWSKTTTRTCRSRRWPTAHA
jgi:transcriptional regulator GlxA family with amidase domain